MPRWIVRVRFAAAVLDASALRPRGPGAVVSRRVAGRVPLRALSMAAVVSRASIVAILVCGPLFEL
ncbi:hypothetical protein [Rhodococcus triatomae]|nr:hypothetical protein G419_06187 [Rhodococcus triatomae BKS 15-14]